MYEIEELQLIRHKLKKKLDSQRYEHTLGVSFTSAALAMRWGADIRKAELAGLLHDCAKHFTEEELIAKCREDGVFLGEEELKSPAVIHGKLGKYLAEHKYGIQDADILNAISYHTTGRENMSLLEKIVFTADYIEPCRDRAPGLPEVRRLAFEDLDLCMYKILTDTIGYLTKKGAHIHADTMHARDYLKGKAKKKGMEPDGR